MQGCEPSPRQRYLLCLKNRIASKLMVMLGYTMVYPILKAKHDSSSLQPHFTPINHPKTGQGRRWPVAVALLKAFARLRTQPSVLAKDSENAGRKMPRYMAALGETRGTNWYSVVFWKFFRQFFLCIGT